MSKIRVNGFSISADGYGAGAEQSLADPLGKGGEDIHPWMVETRHFKAMYGKEGGAEGVDNDYTVRAMANLGAWVMGRNMFGPVRGEWPDHEWKGWWGDNPPYHCPVFVLTHHARPPLEMDGGTVFHFVTEGPEAALELARAAAGDRDVRIGGGVSTVRHYLKTRAIDEMHLAIAPALLGKGEALLEGIDLPALGYRVAEQAVGERALHLVIARG
ncbi:dihydrofolate reductase family protein [Sphingomonas sp. BT-65]|uniref:dihydrofolate reductase family protein n=1 Tax=Sphingomonas sp. BT-65 TaxID=2989821 RepID=UPI002235B230|nr:dihydrofolate reductase family protein [Sphingomonas sp. BT-65]MCW4461970.1 dihydrofolate reductase family protein [Sphingomonas sp. BT-65]